MGETYLVKVVLITTLIAECLCLKVNKHSSNHSQISFENGLRGTGSAAPSDQGMRDSQTGVKFLDDYEDPGTYMGKRLGFAVVVSLTIVVLSSLWEEKWFVPSSACKSLLAAFGERKCASICLLGALVTTHLWILSLGTPISLVKPLQRSQNMAKEFTWEDVAKHNRPGDAWVVIENSVYDISDFAERHSGGPMIYQGAGSDATVYFYQSHPYSKFSKVTRILKSLRIGVLKSGNSLVMSNDTFQLELNKRIDQKLQGVPRRPMGPIILSHLKVIGYIGSFYFAFVHGSILGAILLRLMTDTLLGLEHGLSHGMILEPKSQYLNQFSRVVGAFCPPVVAYASDAPRFPANRLYGIDDIQTYISDSFRFGNPVDQNSSWGSAAIHFGHHTYAGDWSRDPDMRMFREPYFWLFTRNSDSRPLHWYHKYQHLYKYPIDVLNELLCPFDYFVRPLRILTVAKKIAGSDDFEIHQKALELYRLANNVVFGPLHLEDGLSLPLVGLFFLHPAQLLKVLFIPLFVDSWTINNVKWGTSLMHHAHVTSKESPDTPLSIRQFDHSADVHYFTTNPDSWLAPIESLMRYSDNGYHYQAIHHVLPTLSPAYYGLAQEILLELSPRFNVTYHRFDWVTGTLGRIEVLRKWGSAKQTSQQMESKKLQVDSTYAIRQQ